MAAVREIDVAAARAEVLAASFFGLLLGLAFVEQPDWLRFVGNAEHVQHADVPAAVVASRAEHLDEYGPCERRGESRPPERRREHASEYRDQQQDQIRNDVEPGTVAVRPAAPPIEPPALERHGGDHR